jgi:hypothetical protein
MSYFRVISADILLRIDGLNDRKTNREADKKTDMNLNYENL